jgi:hypothetical protein
VDIWRRLFRIDAYLRQLLDTDQIRERFNHAYCPGARVRNPHSKLLLLRIGFDPDRLLAPSAGLRPFPFLDREPHEGDAECIYSFFGTFGALLERLVQDVVVRPAQTAPDNLFGEEW